jgi:hypothetical protein
MEKAVIEKVNEIVTVELVEQKLDEVEKKVDEVTDKVLDSVQDGAQGVADTVEDVVEKVAKPLTDLLDKIDDDPRVKAVLDGITDSVAEQIDGRVVSCGCFGWLFALRITRNRPPSSPSTASVIDNKLPELPPLREAVTESPPSIPVADTPSEKPTTETVASA